MPRIYTLEEVAQHSTAKDLWIVVHGKVYDISNYLEDHPGGGPILVEVAGQDATEAFEDVGHSDEARELLEPFLIGELPPDPSRVVIETYRPDFQVVSQESDGFKKPSTSKRIAKFAARTLLVGSIGLAAHRFNWISGASLLRTDFSQMRKSLIPRLSGAGAGGGGFWIGFAISSTLSTSFILAAVNQLNKILNPNQSYAKYPARRKFRTSAHPVKPKAVVVPVLDARIYSKFPLIEKTKLSHDSYRLVFALPNTSDSIGIPTGQHVSVRASIKGEVVSRSYTPTSNNSDLGRLELVVKVYPNGKLTTYLSALKIGDEVEFAGPKGAMKYAKGLCKHIGMVAGGSGITPMYQIIRAICEDPNDDTTISLLYANKTESDILLREQLDRFAKECPEKFKVHYVLDTPPERWAYSKGYVTKELMREKLPMASPDSKVFLCGPPPMINAMKKNLGDLGFKTPGALSRMTDQVFTF